MLIRSSRNVVLLLGLAFGASTVFGCGATQGTATGDIGNAENRAIDARLQGPWKIGNFTPEEPFGPVLQGMYNYHQQVMVIYFENGRIRADSPGIFFDRRYEVTNAQGERFQLIAYDETGTPQMSYCDFQPDGSVRVSMTSPWRGVGTLVRPH
jgi:hypothetical protein